jgi:hypothetical protein
MSKLGKIVLRIARFFRESLLRFRLGWVFLLLSNCIYLVVGNDRTSNSRLPQQQNKHVCPDYNRLLMWIPLAYADCISERGGI